MTKRIWISLFLILLIVVPLFFVSNRASSAMGHDDGWSDTFIDSSRVEAMANLTIGQGNVTLDTLAIVAGNAAAASPDNWYLLNQYTDVDLTNPVSSDGRLTQWQIYAISAGNAKLKIFRDNGTDYIFVAETAFQSFGVGLNTYDCSIEVEKGDLIGTYVASGNLDAWVVGSTGTEVGRKEDVMRDLPKSSWVGYNDTLPAHASGFTFKESGSLTSISIVPYSIGEWGTLLINKTEPDNSSVKVSILDGHTNETISGFEDLTDSTVSLSSINATDYPSLRLRGQLVGTALVTPILHEWSINWTSAPLPSYSLNVTVVDSCGQPVNNATVAAANAATYTDISGNALLNLPSGTYNVTATQNDYLPGSWTVDLDENKKITLTLAFPYVFQGEIPDSDIILTPVETGYNITLLNSLTSSPMDVFIEWNYVGTIPAGTWQTFSYNHLPDLIVEAASKGSSDSPNAWYKHPLPIPLVPTTGQEGAFLQEPVPFAAGSIFVTPYPPVYGQNATIGVTLHDPFNYTLNISRIDFQISSLNIGGHMWTSVGYLSNVTLQSNETSIFSIGWLATVSGHHCVRVVLTYSPESQTLQRNMDIEYDVLQGKTGEASFTLTNPYETDKTITLKVSQTLPPDWQTELEINGLKYSTSSDITLSLAAGEQLNVILRIDSSSSSPGQADVSVQGYIDGQPIGGVRKTMQTVPITYPQFNGYYLASYPDGKPIMTANMGEPFEIVVSITNPDKVAHTYNIELDIPTHVSTPNGAPMWNWPNELLAEVMKILGAPAQWPANDQWKDPSSSGGWVRGSFTKFVSKTVEPGQSADFVYSFTCRWDWIPPWSWEYLASSVIWNILGGEVEQLQNIAHLAEIAQTAEVMQKVLAWSEKFVKTGAAIFNEQFDFQVSFESTILGTGGVPATVLYSTDPKIYEYIASIVASIPAATSTAAGIASLAGGPELVPLALILLFAQVDMILVQNALYVGAADPSLDYTQVIQPVPTTLLNGTEMMELPVVMSMTRNMQNIVQTLVSLLEYQNATIISIERYAGARDAGDQYYQNLQLQALTTYASHRDQLLSLFENQLSSLSPLLAPLNTSTIGSVETYLLQNGLPAVEQQLLVGLGLSSSVPDITTGLEAFLNVTLLTETMFTQFSLINGTQTLQSLLTMETNTWKQQLLPTTYQITFDQEGVGNDFQGTILTIDGTNYTESDLPMSFWWDNDSTHTFTFQSPLLVGLDAKEYYWASTTDLSTLQSDSITITGPGNVTGNYAPLAHDVAVTSVVPIVPHCSNKVWNDSWVFQGRPVYVNVAVLNKGDFDENMTVTLYYNSTNDNSAKGIDLSNILLSAGRSLTIVLEWNTTAIPYCLNYTITAVATMSTDNNPADNTQAYGPITVRIMGDINGDGKVDGKDIVAEAISFPSWGPDFLYSGSPPGARWNLDCDINCDNKIDGKDLVLTAMNFGK
jgi:hypothetical protein